MAQGQDAPYNRHCPISRCNHGRGPKRTERQHDAPGVSLNQQIPGQIAEPKRDIKEQDNQRVVIVSEVKVFLQSVRFGIGQIALFWSVPLHRYRGGYSTCCLPGPCSRRSTSRQLAKRSTSRCYSYQTEQWQENKVHLANYGRVSMGRLGQRWIPTVCRLRLVVHLPGHRPCLGFWI